MKKKREVELELASFNAQSVINEFRRNLLNYGPPKDGIIRVSPGVVELMLARLKVEKPREFAKAEKAILEGRVETSELGWETYVVQADSNLEGYDVDWGVKTVVNQAL